MKRAICYVDGLNLYHSISALKKPQLKWLDLWTLAQSFLTNEDELQAVVYFAIEYASSATRVAEHLRRLGA